jgi:hypothetical protein
VARRKILSEEDTEEEDSTAGGELTEIVNEHTGLMRIEKARRYMQLESDTPGLLTST